MHMTRPRRGSAGAERYAAGAAAIVSGSGGIGQAIARVLAASGAEIAVTYHRNRNAADKLVGEICDAGRRAAAYQVDLRDAEAVAAFHGDVQSHFGGLHTAVYAAGPYIDMRFIGSLEPARFASTLGTELVWGGHHFFFFS